MAPGSDGGNHVPPTQLESLLAKERQRERQKQLADAKQAMGRVGKRALAALPPKMARNIRKIQKLFPQASQHVQEWIREYTIRGRRVPARKRKSLEKTLRRMIVKQVYMDGRSKPRSEHSARTQMQRELRAYYRAVVDAAEWLMVEAPEEMRVYYATIAESYLAKTEPQLHAKDRLDPLASFDGDEDH